MLAFAGFVMVVLLVLGLVKLKLVPISVFSTLPLLTALLLGFGVTDSLTMVAKGIIGVLPVAALFVGSITYFGIMSDVGLFERPVNWLTHKIKPSVFSVLCITVCVAIISHLDGSGATTLLITVPALLPVVKAMKIRVLPFAFMVTMTISVMNLLPWGGPLGRAATVLGTDATTLWRAVLPVQIFGIALLFVTCWLVARVETRKGYFDPTASLAEVDRRPSPEEEALRRPKLFWANLVLTVVVIALLFAGVPAFLPFLIGVGVALPMNYFKEGERGQTARIKAHAKDVVPMIITIIGAGALLGVLENTGMIDAMATAIVSVIPESLGGILHVLMGILAIPMSLVFEADTMNYGILPVVSAIGESYGIQPVRSALAIAIGHNVGVGLCMTSASVYLGLGLFGLEYSDTIKYSFLKSILFGICLILFGALIGVL